LPDPLGPRRRQRGGMGGGGGVGARCRSGRKRRQDWQLNGISLPGDGWILSGKKKGILAGDPEARGGVAAPYIVRERFALWKCAGGTWRCAGHNGGE